MSRARLPLAPFWEITRTGSGVWSALYRARSAVVVADSLEDLCDGAGRAEEVLAAVDAARRAGAKRPGRTG